MGHAYITLSDFKAGLDTRRLAVSAAPGSLQTFQNAHINRGGEIVISKAWVSTYSLPAGTFGLQAASGSLYVFGSGTTPGGMPAGVEYQQLANPDASAMTAVTMSTVFSGNTYVVAVFADGTSHHFYDGSIVVDWYEGLVRTSMSNNAGIAQHLANAMAEDPIVTASVLGDVITLTGQADNDDYSITATTVDGGGTDDQSAVVAQTQAAGASQPEINTVTIGGTFEAGDKFTITIDDNTYGASSVTGEVAATIVTHKGKMYAGAGKNLLFSCIADASLWRNNTYDTANVGAGVIDIASQAQNDEDITGLGIYQNQLAIFSRNSIQVWSMDADPDSNVQLQVMPNTGTRSPKAIQAFGDLDVFYLADSGYRSLRARDSSNSASVTDVGTPIDELVIAKMATLTASQIANIPAVIEPKDGRYISVLDETQYVFTYFGSSKISAWSTYESDIAITDFAVLNGRVYGRAGDTIYLLGGASDATYTTDQVVVELPYLDANSLGHWKQWHGLDVVCVGTWKIYVNTNPEQPDEWVLTAIVTGNSIGQMMLGMQQYSPVIKFKLTHDGDGETPAKISKLIVHYKTAYAE